MSEIIFHRKPAACYKKGRGGADIRAIILHSTDGHAQGDIATLTGTSRNVSVHWYIEKDGTIWHFVDDADTAYHAGEVDVPGHNNSHTLGIEQEHMDGEEPWLPIQIQTVANLVAALRQKHGLHLPVLSHAQVARPVGRKEDPKEFPWDTFNRLTGQALNQTWTFREAGQ